MTHLVRIFCNWAYLKVSLYSTAQFVPSCLLPLPLYLRISKPLLLLLLIHTLPNRRQSKARLFSLEMAISWYDVS